MYIRIYPKNAWSALVGVKLVLRRQKDCDVEKLQQCIVADLCKKVSGR